MDMPSSSGVFTLTINTNAGFGERLHSENAELRYMLMQVAQQVGSGVPSRHIIDRNGNDVGSYSFGVGSLNAGR
jgi:hypothetical protein